MADRPGSSLKGMLRSMAEMVGGGCISLSGSLYPRGSYGYANHADPPQGFAPVQPLSSCSTASRAI